MKKSSFVEYIKGSTEEITKVTWPTKKQSVRLTIIVLVFCFIMTVILGGLDYLLNEAYNFILSSTA